MKRHLTVAAVERIKPPREGQMEIFDRGFPGLALRISYGGAKSFVIFYTLNGRLRRLTVGQHPAITLLDARDAWREVRQSVARGIDPARAKAATTAAMGFPEVAAEWLRRDQADNRPSSIYQVRRIIETDLLPAWGSKRIDEITKRDALELLDGIVDRGSPSKAHKVYAHLSRLFRWCLERDILKASPMTSVARPEGGAPRERTLTDDELVAIWRGAEGLGLFGAITRLLILTGARLNEIGQLRWAEINCDAISLPGDRTKNGRPFLIPLSTPAKELLDQLPRIAGCDFVFSLDGRRPVSSSHAKVRLDAVVGVKNWRLHDIRRTVATGMGELGVLPHVVEACLNHVSGHKAGIAGTYNKAVYAPEKAAALQVWGAHVMALVR